MRILRDHLKIVFGRVKPEMLISCIKFKHYGGDIDRPVFTVSGSKLSSSAYVHYSGSIYKNLTYEETEARYLDMIEVIERRKKLGGSGTLFALLPEYTCRVLRELDGEIVCRQEEVLNWRDCYFTLGQDLLTSAHLAYMCCCEERTVSDFAWPPMIRTDDLRLANVTGNGLAENHFHLTGSTRVFDLSWLCLMNHPERIKDFFEMRSKMSDEEFINNFFKVDLSGSESSGESDITLRWADRLYLACWLRAQLFKWIEKGKYDPYKDKKPGEELCNLLEIIKCRDLNDLFSEIEVLRFCKGASGGFGKTSFRLIDYAITNKVADGISPDRAARSLVGERALLFNALYRIFSRGVADYDEFVDFFYLYVLIKMKFRAEMIQVNGRNGFKNFARYQDRKDLIFEVFSEYNDEAKNLSVNESLKNGHVSSLEMRITPANEVSKQFDKILQTDKVIWQLGTSDPDGFGFTKEKTQDAPYFYVLHFPKLPEKPEDIVYFELFGHMISFDPRNNNVRSKTKVQAKVIATALEVYPWLGSRIRGIDACTYEIGCRPEVFATEFRFLRMRITHRIRGDFYVEEPSASRLCVTYHVGEDYMDVLDGLRAIDEVLTFLEMEPGDRLGHAMVLGIDAHDYYASKNRYIVLKKQDYLDNIVWAINKSRALGIELNISLLQELRVEADHLINEIYGTDFSFGDYYNGYRLRGDSPELYQNGIFDDDEYRRGYRYGMGDITGRYNFCRIQQRYRREELDDFRRGKPARIFWMYHFDKEVRDKGSTVVSRKVSEAYIKMACALQKGISGELVKHRIAIECNPSSNVLIGPFDRYELHPIFRFYPVAPKAGEEHQFVSVNTDDQGVFDTSLENEYALLLGALRSMKNEDGASLYNDDEMYGYLERLRKNGFSQAFAKSKKT